MKKSIVFIILSFMLASCGIMFQGESPESDKPSKEMIAKVSFNDVMKVVFEPKCISCHGRAGGINLETYQSARQYLKIIAQSTLIDKRMPKAPVSKLTKEEAMVLQAWIEAGGPEVPQVGSPSPGQSEPSPPDSSELEPTYSSIRDRILVPKCIVCHEPGGEAANIPMVTRNDLIDSPLEIVIPGNAEESMMMIVFQEGARKPMPTIESGISPLTPEQKRIIEKWINDGAGE